MIDIYQNFTARFIWIKQSWTALLNWSFINHIRDIWFRLGDYFKYLNIFFVCWAVSPQLISCGAVIDQFMQILMDWKWCLNVSFLLRSLWLCDLVWKLENPFWQRNQSECREQWVSELIKLHIYPNVKCIYKRWPECWN